MNVFLFSFVKFYLFIHERFKEREAKTKADGWAGSLAGNLMWNLIPRPRDHNLSQRQMLNHRATQVPEECISYHIHEQYFVSKLQWHQFSFLLAPKYSLPWVIFLRFINLFQRERARTHTQRGGAEGEGARNSSRFHTECRAGHGTQSHDSWDHDLSWTKSWALNCQVPLELFLSAPTKEYWLQMAFTPPFSSSCPTSYIW